MSEFKKEELALSEEDLEQVSGGGEGESKEDMEVESLVELDVPKATYDGYN